MGLADRTIVPARDPQRLGLGRMDFGISIRGMDDDLHGPLTFLGNFTRTMPCYYMTRELG